MSNDDDEKSQILSSASTSFELSSALNHFTKSSVSEYHTSSALLDIFISKIDSIIVPNANEDANVIISIGHFFLWFIPPSRTAQPAFAEGRYLCWSKPEINDLFKFVLLPAMVHHLKKNEIDSTTKFVMSGRVVMNASADLGAGRYSWKNLMCVGIVRSICRLCLDDIVQLRIFGKQQVVDQILTIGECIPECWEAVSWIGGFCKVLCCDRRSFPQGLTQNALLFATKRAARIMMKISHDMEKLKEQFPFSNMTDEIDVMDKRIVESIDGLAALCPDKIIPLYAAESIASGQLTEFQLALLQTKTTGDVKRLLAPSSSNKLYATVDWKDQIECYKFSTFLLDKLDSDEIPSFTSVSWRSRSDDPLDWLNILAEKWEDMWIYRRLGKADGGWTPYVMWALAQFSQVSGSKLNMPTSPGSAKVILETIAEQTDDAVIGTQTQTTTLSEFCRLISNICKKKDVARIKYFSTEFAAKCMKEAMERTVSEKTKLSAACEEIVALVPECGELFVAHGLVGEGKLRWASSYCVIA